MHKMIFRAKLTSCRSFILLVTIGLVFLTVNFLLIWNQQQGPPQNICVCEPSFNVPGLGDNERGKPPTEEVIQPKDEEDLIPNEPHLTTDTTQDHSEVYTHQLAVVVPFRDRYEEMMEFVPHIHKFLKRQKVQHKILIINQADRHR